MKTIKALTSVSLHNRVYSRMQQLATYYTGYREVYDSHAAYQAKAADKFNLKALHVQFLSDGNAPVK
jgi:hypothetical protein